jgi:hypothetical protein
VKTPVPIIFAITTAVTVVYRNFVVIIARKLFLKSA